MQELVEPFCQFREHNYAKLLYTEFPVFIGINTLIAVFIDLGRGNICILELGWA